MRSVFRSCRNMGKIDDFSVDHLSDKWENVAESLAKVFP